MPRDPVIVGVSAGLTANLIKVLISQPLYLSGRLDHSFSHMAAGFFFEKRTFHAFTGLAYGHFVDFAIGSFLGIILLYLLALTGEKHAIFKGLMYGIYIHVAFFGLAMCKNFTSAKHVTLLSDLLLLISHIAFGVTCAWIIQRYYFSGKKPLEK